MNKKLSWAEIINKYPDQWVSLFDIDKDDKGDVLNANVFASGKNLADAWIR